MTTVKQSQVKKNDILLEPILGISLKKYASISYYLAGEVDEEAFLSEVGLTKRDWNAVDRAWRKRMEDDDSFILITHYSQYYNDAEKYLSIDDI